MVAAAALLLLLIVIGALRDTVRLLAPAEYRRPPRSRLRLRRKDLEAAERRLVVQRLRGEIDAASYRARMRSLADMRRTSPPGRHG